MQKKLLGRESLFEKKFGKSKESGSSTKATPRRQKT